MSETVRLRFKYTEQEYVSAVRAYMRRSPEIIVRLGVFLTLMTFGTFMLSMYSDRGTLLSLIWAGVVLASVVCALFYGVPKRQFRGEPKFRDEYLLEFSDEGIHLTTANIDSKVSWNLYTSVLEQERFYLLIYGKYMMTVVPKRAFNSAKEEGDFRELLKRNLAPQLKANPPGGAMVNELESGYVPPPEPPDWR